MKFKLPKKIKVIKALLSLRYIYALIGLLAVAVIWWLGIFLNENFYQAIIQSDEIILLRREVASHTINVEQFETVLKSLDQKIDPSIDLPDWKIVNPFVITLSAQPETPGEE